MRSNYLHDVLTGERLKAKVETAVRVLREFEQKQPFDAIAVRGNSGTIFGGALAMMLDKGLILVRKPGESSHSYLDVEGDVDASRLRRNVSLQLLSRVVLRAGPYRDLWLDQSFDSQLSWFHGIAFAYLDSYAIYTDPTRNTAIMNAHPEWILRDASGNKLYIPWGCSVAVATVAASCPQYAADIGNGKFVEYMTGLALQTTSPGYSLAFDDINMTLDRVTDVNGNKVAPIDPRTGAAMTEDDWERYFGAYTYTVRNAIKAFNPDYLVMHNAIWWYNAVSTPGIDREVKSADYIAYERGFGDAGIAGGLAQWSLSNYLASMDRVHSLGAHIGLYEFDGAHSFVYSSACYFLITDGLDTIGFTDLTPDKWDSNTTRLMNVDLGTPVGARRRTWGIWERDFSKGFVIVAEPGAAVTYTPDKPVIDAFTGQPVTSIVLGSRQGGVYLYQ